MYCKQCGKQIQDDSLFCQFCGTPQEKILVDKQDNALFLYVKNALKNRTNEQKIWGGVYVFWFFINVFWFFMGIGNGRGKGRGNYDVDYFFPFDGNALKYDMSEFVVYVILLPLLIFYIMKIIKMKKISFRKLFSKREK